MSGKFYHSGKLVGYNATHNHGLYFYPKKSEAQEAAAANYCDKYESGLPGGVRNRRCVAYPTGVDEYELNDDPQLIFYNRHGPNHRSNEVFERRKRYIVKKILKQGAAPMYKADGIFLKTSTAEHFCLFHRDYLERGQFEGGEYGSVAEAVANATTVELSPPGLGFIQDDHDDQAQSDHDFLANPNQNDKLAISEANLKIAGANWDGIKQFLEVGFTPEHHPNRTTFNEPDFTEAWKAGVNVVSEPSEVVDVLSRILLSTWAAIDFELSGYLCYISATCSNMDLNEGVVIHLRRSSRTWAVAKPLVKQIMEKREIVKLVFGCDSMDVSALWRDFNCVMINVIDLQKLYELGQSKWGDYMLPEYDVFRPKDGTKIGLTDLGTKFLSQSYHPILEEHRLLKQEHQSDVDFWGETVPGAYDNTIHSKMKYALYDVIYLPPLLGRMLTIYNVLENGSHWWDVASDMFKKTAKIKHGVEKIPCSTHRAPCLDAMSWNVCMGLGVGSDVGNNGEMFRRIATNLDWRHGIASQLSLRSESDVINQCCLLLKTVQGSIGVVKASYDTRVLELLDAVELVQEQVELRLNEVTHFERSTTTWRDRWAIPLEEMSVPFPFKFAVNADPSPSSITSRDWEWAGARVYGIKSGYCVVEAPLTNSEECTYMEYTALFVKGLVDCATGSSDCPRILVVYSSSFQASCAASGLNLYDHGMFFERLLSSGVLEDRHSNRLCTSVRQIGGVCEVLYDVVVLVGAASIKEEMTSVKRGDDCYATSHAAGCSKLEEVLKVSQRVFVIDSSIDFETYSHFVDIKVRADNGLEPTKAMFVVNEGP